MELLVKLDSLVASRGESRRGIEHRGRVVTIQTKTKLGAHGHARFIV